MENNIFSLLCWGIGSIIRIINNQFLGDFTAEKAIITGSLTFANITFFNKFSFNETRFNKRVIFDNIAFSKPFDKEAVEQQILFAKTLEKNDLKEMVLKLGLPLSETTSKKISKFDYDAYKVAYETGYLKSEYAAYLLEKSVSYLSQKRKKDKEMITRDSIPFIGEGKNIKYPVEALLAYKAKNWDKLKELRQKYKEIED